MCVCVCVGGGRGEEAYNAPFPITHPPPEGQLGVLPVIFINLLIIMMHFFLLLFLLFSFFFLFFYFSMSIIFSL